jgi:hypothetical protein
VNTRQMETVGQVIGGILGAAIGVPLFIGIQILLELNFGFFYLVGLIGGAATGASLGSWLVLRSRKKTKIAPGVFITAPGWKSSGTMAEGVKLTKGEGRMVITLVRGDKDATPASIMEKYAGEGALELKGAASPVTVAGPALDVGTGERRSFTASVDGQAFEGDVTAFVVKGEGLVFNGSAPAGTYAGMADEIQRMVTSLERA